MDGDPRMIDFFLWSGHEPWSERAFRLACQGINERLFFLFLLDDVVIDYLSLLRHYLGYFTPFCINKCIAAILSSRVFTCG